MSSDRVHQIRIMVTAFRYVSDAEMQRMGPYLGPERVRFPSDDTWCAINGSLLSHVHALAAPMVERIESVARFGHDQYTHTELDAMAHTQAEKIESAWWIDSEQTILSWERLPSPLDGDEGDDEEEVIW